MSAPAIVSRDTVKLSERRVDRRAKSLWTIGNLLMLAGVYLLLYVGGLFADEQFNLWAAQGDSDIPVAEVAAAPASEQESTPAPTAPARTTAPVAQLQPATAVAATAVPATPIPVTPVPTEPPEALRLPELNAPPRGSELSSLIPAPPAEGYGPSTITRIAIPSIKVDKKVVEVNWQIQDVNGEQVAVWDVAKYVVGHHSGTANPGQPGNIVLAGHSGGNAYPFNNLFYLKPGDPITLWSDGQEFQYTVTEHHLLDEIGPNVTLEQRKANARFIEPTDNELVTLVTCWPLTGKNKFSQRVVIRAVPAQAAAPNP